MCFKRLQSRLAVALLLLVAPALVACSAGFDRAPVVVDVVASPTMLPVRTPGVTAMPSLTVPRPTPIPAPTPTAPTRAGELSLVGALQLEPFNSGTQGDVAAYKSLAFVGKGRGSCPGTGVDIVDISDPAAPTKIADTDDYARTAMEDMQALRIVAQDVLAIGLQLCGGDPEAGTRGLELVDITDSRHPERISLFPTGAHGVHELDVAITPSGRALALLAVPDLEAETAGEDGQGGTGDLLIVDISDPRQPVQIAEWGMLDEPALGQSLYTAVQQGGDSRTLLHSVRANAQGTRAYLSYWDAGVVILDIIDPARPHYLGRTSFPVGAEGNAHSVDEGQDGSLLIQADEDFSPFGTVITSTALTESRSVAEASFSPRLVDLPTKQVAGDVVHVGRGCPAGPPGGGEPEDPYLADAEGKIALIERGKCPFDAKVARAQQAGASAAIIYNSDDNRDSLVAMSGERSVTLGDGSAVAISIPAIFITRDTGLALRDALTPVTARLTAEFNGWGYLRFFDIRDPAAPVALGMFATEKTTEESAAEQGMWSVHNPEVQGTLLFASWYNDGIRVIDIADPSAPREIASWTGAGAPDGAPPVDIWSVVPHGDLLVASDLNFGLYILRFEP